MVGLSVVLEAQKGGHSNKIKNNPQVINKATMSSPSTAVNPGRSSQRFFPAPAFLERCFLCKVKLLPGKDIYMYKGDRAFCSVECRCRQIFMDEEETVRKDQNCSMAAIKPNNPSSSSSTTPSHSPSSSRHRKGGRNHGAGGFAY